MTACIYRYKGLCEVNIFLFEQESGDAVSLRTVECLMLKELYLHLKCEAPLEVDEDIDVHC